MMCLLGNVMKMAIQRTNNFRLLLAECQSKIANTVGSNGESTGTFYKI